MKLIITIGALILASIGIILIYGKYRWQIGTDNLRAKFASGRQIIEPKFYSQTELAGLPAPVQRYFQKVLRDGQPMVPRAKFSQKNVGWALPTTTSRLKHKYSILEERLRQQLNILIILWWFPL